MGGSAEIGFFVSVNAQKNRARAIWGCGGEAPDLQVAQRDTARDFRVVLTISLASASLRTVQHPAQLGYRDASNLSSSLLSECRAFLLRKQASALAQLFLAKTSEALI